MATNTYLERIDKFFSKIFINCLRCCHHKFHTVASSQIEYFGNIKFGFKLLKFWSEIFLTDNQFPEFFQFDLLVRKCYNF